MKILENNDFLTLNSIIYKIHSLDDLTETRKTFLEMCKLVLDFDCADFYLAATDGSTKLGEAVNYNCRSDFSKIYEDQDYSQGILGSGKTMVYRESDIISEEKRIASDYYKNVYKANGWHFSLQMIFSYDEDFLGVATFYRKTGKADFKYADVFIMEILKDHMALRLYKEKSKPKSEKMPFKEAVEVFNLTKRETEVLRLLLTGMTSEDICDEMVISNNTLKKHILNIYRKCHVNNRIQLYTQIDVL